MIIQVLAGAQKISIGALDVKAARDDTLDRDFLLPECQANKVHGGIGLAHRQAQVSTQIRGLHHVCTK